MRTDVVRLGRLSGDRTGEMMHFLSSMRSDRCIGDADLLVDLAATVLMLEKQKIIDPDIAKQLLSALLELFEEGIPEEVFDERFEDVHAGIESHLVESMGPEVGGRMHMGRSRNDEVATCIRIKLREDLLKQMSALLKVREVLLPLLRAYRDRDAGFYPSAACPAHHACSSPPCIRTGVLAGTSTGSRIPMFG